MDLICKKNTTSEVFKNGTTLPEMLAYGIKEGAEKLEQVIKNTYPKDTADEIIAIINSII
jgi:hypothetical protein